MSLRLKKPSAFAVFKGNKASSTSDIDQLKELATPKQGKLQKSESTSNTPTGSLTSIVAKLKLGSERKKLKSEVKKLKKSIKRASAERPSYLPDSALNSPVAANGNVQLKSVKPQGSMVNIRYPLPLQSVAGKSLQRNIPETKQPPSVPKPRKSPRHQKKETLINSPVKAPALPPRKSAKKTEKDATPPPPLPPRSSRKHDLPAVDKEGSVTQAAKKRKLNAENRMGRNKVRLPAIEENAGSTPGPAAAAAADPEESTDQPYMHDSSKEAQKLFECLIHPVKPQKFFSELWEKKPLLVKRHTPNYNDGWFSTSELDTILRKHELLFGLNLDVTSYENNQRETHNPPGRAHAAVVWDYYQNGCSVRMLNPQTYSRNVWKLLSLLQEYFGSFTGANIYLTPPGTQGFAPHYDDIEAFILQLEGKKHWRLYNPRSDSETLPRFSSPNYSQDEIGEPILDVILEAGDLLYFPRGIIHQGNCMEDAHSLHITVSTCQKNTWGDLLENLVPRALQIAIEEDLDFRKALPRDYLNYMGIANSELDTSQRKAFLRKIEQLMSKLLAYAPVDSAVDQMGKQFIHKCLPPVFTEREKACSIFGNGERWDDASKGVVNSVELEPDTEIKIIRKGALRLLTEGEGQIYIYHTLENARVYQAKDPQLIEIPPEAAPAVEFLIHSYPDYVTIESLPMETLQEKVELVSTLYDKGLVITCEPLEPVEDQASSDEEMGPPPETSQLL